MRILLIATICLSTQGCWEAKQDLIPDEVADNPFGDAKYILFEAYDSDITNLPFFLVRKIGKHEIFYRNPLSHDDFKDSAVIKFYNVGSFFGPKEFIVGMTIGEKGDSYQYSYIVQKKDAWYLHSDEGSIHKNIFRESVSSLSQIVDDLEKVKKNNRLNLVPMYNIIRKIDSIQAAQLRQLHATAYENVVRKEREEKLEKERRAAAIKQQERQKAEQERKKSEETRLATIARNDREPSQAEMIAAVRRTLAGSIFNASVRKLGSCRKAAAYDYYCRYQWGGVNWGNFWKTSGTWYFKIVDE